MVTLIFCRDDSNSCNMNSTYDMVLSRISQHPPPPQTPVSFASVGRPLLSDYVNVQRVVKQEHAKWQNCMASMRRFCSCVRTRIALLKEVYQARYSGSYICTVGIKILSLFSPCYRPVPFSARFRVDSLTLSLDSFRNFSFSNFNSSKISVTVVPSITCTYSATDDSVPSFLRYSSASLSLPIWTNWNTTAAGVCDH